MKRTQVLQSVLVMALTLALALPLVAATISTKRAKKPAKVTEASSTQKKVVKTRKRRVRRSAYQWINGHRVKRNRYYERFVASSFTDEDQTVGDVTAGEDP
ncbi:MAG TPA: penicillin-binding protein, partial [Terriglobales bacterium]|nr:penicillin-binding protein [Terriglobales bacterium]